MGRHGSGPEPEFLLADEIEFIRSVLGAETPSASILRALSAAGNNLDRAINLLLDAPSEAVPVSSSRHTGFIKKNEPNTKDAALMPMSKIKEDPDEMVCNKDSIFQPKIIVKKEEADHGDRYPLTAKKEEPAIGSDGLRSIENLVAKKGSFLDDCEEMPNLTEPRFAPYLNPRPVRSIKPGAAADRRIQLASAPDLVERGDFLVEPDWFLVGKTFVTGLSTCRGRGKLEPSEIVHFSFPSSNVRKNFGRNWVSSKTASAVS